MVFRTIVLGICCLLVSCQKHHCEEHDVIAPFPVVAEHLFDQQTMGAHRVSASVGLTDLMYCEITDTTADWEETDFEMSVCADMKAHRKIWTNYCDNYPFRFVFETATVKNGDFFLKLDARVTLANYWSTLTYTLPLTGDSNMVQYYATSGGITNWAKNPQDSMHFVGGFTTQFGHYDSVYQLNTKYNSITPHPSDIRCIYFDKRKGIVSFECFNGTVWYIEG